MALKPKKVMHIIIGLGVGGAELMLKRLLIHSKNSDEVVHEVVSLTDLGLIGQDLKSAGFNVHTLNMKSAFDLPITYLKLRKVLKNFNPDVVQTWMYHADFMGGLAARSLGIKNVVWGIRTTDVSQNNAKVTVGLSKVCARLSYTIPRTIICAADVSKEYHASMGYDKDKMIVIPNGFDIDSLYATHEDTECLRKLMNLSKDDIVVGSVGRFSTEKNQRLFIDAANILIKKNPHLKFIMVGRDNDLKNEDLVAWIKAQGIMNNFRLLGQRDDVATCLSLMNVFCLHSKTEGFPNVLAEAMAMEIPCVATDVGDAKHIMGDFGTLVAKNDKNGLAQAIKDIVNTLSLDNLKKNEENNSRQYIIDNFSMDTVYAKYLCVWNN
ncbi:glycosyltransferase family 4 protein [Psychrobacter immobilis]|uniref:glycosyltransferase family 4 protein n=1 Tax=Psychrobacter immobilis TaxID=498 RepID=UPI00191A5A3D|nr:glycosyltransferase [Psychrobacter immobilis]